MNISEKDYQQQQHQQQQQDYLSELSNYQLPHQEKIAKKLFRYAMKSNWEVVINIYRNSPEAHKLKITRSGDTALHIAISDGQKSTVEELVKVVEAENEGALEMQNDAGNTPLHLAAQLGNVNMCDCIASVDPTLMGIRNKEKETPLFLAVLHGRKQAYRRLTSLCKDSPRRYGYCRGKDGSTILHSAIDGEYFEMAFHIIHYYEELLTSVNERGLSPLHTLASKPSAFRSGSHFSCFDQLIYYCISVDEINLDTVDTLAEGLEYDTKNPKYPENYQTCVGLFLFVRNLVRILMGRVRLKYDAITKLESEKSNNKNEEQQPVVQQQPDEETPEVQQEPDVHEQVRGRRQPHDEESRPNRAVPENYTTCFNILQILSKLAMSVICVLPGPSQLKRMKRQHVWSVQIMRKLIEHASLYEYENHGTQPPRRARYVGFFVSDIHETTEVNGNEKGEALEWDKKETPLLIAAKNGIIEMVEEILRWSPMAINDMNTDKKNVVLLVVENRQPVIYNFLLNRYKVNKSIFQKTDKEGNNALHLAANMIDNQSAWCITNAALQLQWEIKWYQYVTKSMPLNSFVRHNIKGKTPSDIFNKYHRDLVSDAGKWLKDTSQSCSVVAGLIATVAFATSTTVPGGVMENIGTPTLQHEEAFSLFGISSLIALCFSITSIIMFLAVVTSSYSDKEFVRILQKLMVGLASLFISLSAMLVSFCAAHFLIMKDQLKYAAIPMYIVIIIVMTCYVVAQFSWYIDVVKITTVDVPPRVKNFFE